MSISDLFRATGPVIGPTQEKLNSPASRPEITKPDEFKEILNEQLRLSSHAETRIRSRAIPWNEEIERRILGGIESAEAKGSREALILADNVAVIANVKSKTVITALDKTQLKEKIFTNIDSAVIV